MKTEKTNEAKQNLPWRQQNRIFPYPHNLKDMLEDPVYIADRNQLFRDNGNGWWWNVYLAALKRK